MRPSGWSRWNLDSSVNITLDHWRRVHRRWRRDQARRAVLWARVSLGRLTGRRAWRCTSCRRLLMVDLDTWVLVAVRSCPLIRFAVLVLDVVACRATYLSSLRVVFRGLPDRGRSWTLPVACHFCRSLQMTDGATWSRLATSRTAILSWSQARARPRLTSDKERLCTMLIS